MKISILGNSGHAKVIADIVRLNGDEPVFIKKGDEFKIGDCYSVIGVGDAKIRKKIVDKFDLNYVTAIHPSAVVANDVCGNDLYKEGRAVYQRYNVVEHKYFQSIDESNGSSNTDNNTFIK